MSHSDRSELIILSSLNLLDLITNNCGKEGGREGRGGEGRGGEGRERTKKLSIAFLYHSEVQKSKPTNLISCMISGGSTCTKPPTSEMFVEIVISSV